CVVAAPGAAVPGVAVPAAGLLVVVVTTGGASARKCEKLNAYSLKKGRAARFNGAAADGIAHRSTLRIIGRAQHPRPARAEDPERRPSRPVQAGIWGRFPETARTLHRQSPGGRPP